MGLQTPYIPGQVMSTHLSFSCMSIQCYSHVVASLLHTCSSQQNGSTPNKYIIVLTVI